MEADDAIFRERIVWKVGYGIGVAGAVECLAGLTLLGTAAMSGQLAPAIPGAILAVAGVFMALAGLLAGVLRIAVTPSALRVQFMTTALEIPFERIRTIRAERYDWTAYGGWGLRMSLSGKRAMSVTGVGNRGLAIVYVDAEGKERSLFVSSKDPEAVLHAIERAGAGASGYRGARVRVEEGATDDAVGDLAAAAVAPEVDAPASPSMARRADP